MSLPGILVFFVVRNRLKPMVFRICASISSSSASSLKSTSIASSWRSGPGCAPFAFCPTSRDRGSLRSPWRSLLGPRGGDRAFVPLRCGERERERSRNLTFLGALPDIYMLAWHEYFNNSNLSPTASILVALPASAPLSVLGPTPISVPVAAISRPASISPSILAFL